MTTTERSAEAFFHDATRAYREGHQACLACQRSHCVFYSVCDRTEEYRCFQCGFCIGKDLHSGNFVVGQEEIETSSVLDDDAPGLLDQLENHPVLRTFSGERGA